MEPEHPGLGGGDGLAEARRRSVIVSQQRVTAYALAVCAEHQKRDALGAAWRRYAHMVDALSAFADVAVYTSSRYRDSSVPAVRRELDELCRSLARDAAEGVRSAKRSGEHLAAARADVKAIDALTTSLSAQLDVIAALQGGP